MLNVHVQLPDPSPNSWIAAPHEPEHSNRNNNNNTKFLTSKLSSNLLRSLPGPINYVDTIAKCRHLKTFTCKGTWRQVFIFLRPPALQ
jgi:hypothetical protein